VFPARWRTIRVEGAAPGGDIGRVSDEAARHPLAVHRCPSGALPTQERSMGTFTTRDGVQIYYKDWGQGQPVVLLHGWPLSSDMWEYQMNFLASHGHRCIAPDRRGFGRSGQPWQGYDYDTFADDVSALLETLELDRVILVGFSMGGGEVARYLARHGTKRVEKAALVSAVTPMLMRREDNPQGLDPAVFEGFRRAIAADRPAFLEGFGPVFTGANRKGSRVSKAALDWIQFLAFQGSLKGTIQCVTAFSETDFREDMAKFTMPTLVVHGNDDQVVPFEISGKVVPQLVKQAELKVYEGGPHAVFFTHADRLNQDLLAFARG
jgi:pimeloyl-ACP methyl ester carboxylesterase